MEILVVVAIIGILSAIAFPAYKYYIDRAKITLAVSTLETTRKILEDYHIDYATYPETIDFSTGIDSLGRTVFTPAFVAEMKHNLSSVESYTSDPLSYTLTARGQDAAHSLLTLTAGGVITVGHQP